MRFALALVVGLVGCSGQLVGSTPAHDGPAHDNLAHDGPPRDGETPVDTLATVDAPPAVWRPKPGTTWQWQLKGTLDTSLQVQMFDIDLFDQSGAVIAGLRSKGHVVICYFSAGSHEGWRPDAADFPASVIGDKMSGWNESWLDIRAQAVRDIMAKRLDLARTKGCDGVEPDNVDGHANSTGFPLGAGDQLTYNRWLAAEAHKRGLSVGLKNDLEQVIDLLPDFDWALNEQCLSKNECSKLAPFIAAGKAVFHVEYAPAADSATVCPKVKPLGFDTLIKNMDLDAWFEAC